MFRLKGSISLDQMPDSSLRTLRGLSDDDLFKYIAGWKEGSQEWAKGMAELRRRESWTARLALTVSFVALLVSLLRP